MSDIKKIMAAIAFSEYSQGILIYGAKLARAFDAQLIVAHVINSRDVEAIEKIAAQGYNLDGNRYIKELKAQNRETLTQLLKPTGLSDDEVTVILKVGHPADTLLRIIVSEEVDMVVMGVKGRSNLEYALAGSVAEKVFRRSPVAVVSYRDPRHAQRLKERID
jgi:nucleotide-binding universal stress UspA family protein